jgi:hypothetical protein
VQVLEGSGGGREVAQERFLVGLGDIAGVAGEVDFREVREHFEEIDGRRVARRLVLLVGRLGFDIHLAGRVRGLMNNEVAIGEGTREDRDSFFVSKDKQVSTTGFEGVFFFDEGAETDEVGGEGRNQEGIL